MASYVNVKQEPDAEVKPATSATLSNSFSIPTASNVKQDLESEPVKPATSAVCQNGFDSSGSTSASASNMKPDPDMGSKPSASTAMQNNFSAPMASNVKQEPHMVSELSTTTATQNFKGDPEEKHKPSTSDWGDHLDSASMVGSNRRNEEKETFVCEICDDMLLTSRQTMEMHVKGYRHNDNKRECEILLARGELKMMPVVRQTDNPKAMRVKVPVRLHAKLKATTKPIVGLKFIDEIMPRNNTEMEPYYTCNLCGNIGESNAMANHVVQSGHIQKFFEKLFPGKPPLAKAYLEDHAQLFKDNGRLHFINTHRSDLLFPWPQNELVEKAINHPHWIRLRESLVSAEQYYLNPLPNRETIPEIKDDEMQEEYTSFVAEAMARIVDLAKYSGIKMGDEDKAELDRLKQAIEDDLLEVDVRTVGLKKPY